MILLVCSSPFIVGITMSLLSRMSAENPWTEYQALSYFPVAFVIVPGMIVGDNISHAIGLTAWGDNKRRNTFLEQRPSASANVNARAICGDRPQITYF
jgi:hypothetical protein